MKDKLEQERSIGANAKRILEDDLVKNAFDLIESNLMATWKASKADDHEGREECWRMLHALNEVKRHFITAIQTGQMAEHELSILEKTKEKVRKIL